MLRLFRPIKREIQIKNNRAFNVFCEQFKKLNKNEVLKIFYDYIRKED